ncbi:YjzD family protein [Priestia koreensis]|uniref:YjzD family protein n=1 Tax=Priestia koreensis TaxID=284581 RepID=UPI000AE5E12A|nr:YjzD family protein [Priestia koreensis]
MDLEKLLHNEVIFVRIIWTLVWSFLLTHMAAYVIGAMSGASYTSETFTTASIFAVVFTVFIVILGEAGIPNEPAEKH